MFPIPLIFALLVPLKENPATSSGPIPAAAIALADSAAPTAATDLVALSLATPHSALVLETLARYYRDHPPAPRNGCARLPDPRLTEYAARSASADCRAAFGFLSSVVKDPDCVSALLALATDSTPEVRRTAALALGERSIKSGGGPSRVADERADCMLALQHLLLDSNTQVRIAACRSVASYGAVSRAAAVEPVALLTNSIRSIDFNLRVTALEGLARCAAAPNTPATQLTFPTAALSDLALHDSSTSARYSAAIALAAIDSALAAPCVQPLLASPIEYIRTAACEVLGKVATPAAFAQLAALAASDPSLRVRETALTQLALPAAKAAPATKSAVVAALADPDPEIFASGCQIAQADLWREFAPTIAASFSRFPGCANADARAAAIAALVDLEQSNPANSAALHSRYIQFSSDPNPAVRTAALTALATLDHQQPPPFSRGADLSGELYPGGKPVFGPEPYLILETNRGRMKIRLYPDQAPITCGHVAALARRGFYNGLTWHRVVPDFVIQGGCPRGDGSGTAGVTLPLESTNLPFERGTLGMPRDSNPDTGGCQLFICHCRVPHLDVIYCAFGQVVEGMDVIDRIDVDDRIVSARVEGIDGT